MFDQHDGGIGHIDPHFDHRCRHQHVDLALAEGTHGAVPLIGLEPAVHQPYREPGPALSQLVGHRRRSPQVRPLRLFDHRQHHICLPPRLALLPHEVDHPLTLRRRPESGANATPSGGPLPKHRYIEVAVAGQRKRPRDGRGAEQQHVGRGALSYQRRALLDTEAVLFVDYHQPQPPELHTLLHQRMGTYHNARGSVANPTARGALGGRGKLAQQYLRLDPKRLKQSLDGAGVLLGQQLGGRHEGSLVVVLQRQQHGEQRDHRLAGAHVSHEQPVHAPFRGHITHYLVQSGTLVAGEGPGQRGAERGNEIGGRPEDDAAGAGAASQRTRPRERELEVEEFVEREPAAAMFRLLLRRRPMDQAIRLGQAGKAERLPH